MKFPEFLPGNTETVPLHPHVPGGCLHGHAGGDQSDLEVVLHARLQMLEARPGKRMSRGFEGSVISV